MLIVDDDFIAEVRLLPDEDFDFLTFLVGGRHVAQMLVDLGSACYAARQLIYINIYNVSTAFLHLLRLFAMGDEQFLRRAPVGEGTDGVHAVDFQIGELPYGGVWMFVGGDEACLGVLIDEDLQFVAHLDVLRHVAFGHEYLDPFASIEVQAEVNDLRHA